MILLIKGLRNGMAQQRQAQIEFDEREVIKLAYKQLKKQDFDRALILYMHAFEVYPSREVEGYIIFCMNILGQYKGAIEYKGNFIYNKELIINQCFSHLMLGEYVQASSLVKNVQQTDDIVKEINTIILIQQNQQNKIQVDELELQNPIQKCVINQLRGNKRQISSESIKQIQNFINERGAYLKNTGKLVEKIEEIFNTFYTLKKHRIKSLKLYSLISLLFPQSVHYKELEKLLKKMEQIKESKYITCILKLLKLFQQQENIQGFDNILNVITKNIKQIELPNKSDHLDQNIELAYGGYKISKTQIVQREINKQVYEKTLLNSNNTYYRKLGQLYEKLQYFKGQNILIFKKQLNTRWLWKTFLLFIIIQNKDKTLIQNYYLKKYIINQFQYIEFYQTMSIMNIQQIMKFTKYAALLAIGLKISSLGYCLYKEYQLTRPLECKIDCDFEIVWDELNYDEQKITPQTIRDVFNHTLKVGSKSLISITEYMKKLRRYFGWKYTYFCIQNVIEEFNRKIKFSREVIQQMLSYKGYNYQVFDSVAFQGMQNNQIILELNIFFECQVFQQFAECSEQLNKEGIFYYMEQFLDILTKNREQIQQIKNIIINNNQINFKQMVCLAYIHDVWYLSFGFEYQALLNSIIQIPQEEKIGIFSQMVDLYAQQVDKLFE